MERVNFSVKQNEDLALAFNNLDQTTGQPVYVGGWSGTWTIRSFAGSVLATVTAVVDNPDSGVISYPLTTAQTAALPLGACSYDVEVTRDDGSRDFLQTGLLFVEFGSP
jgi:hypothetical protein